MSDIIGDDRSSPGKDEREGPNELRDLFSTFSHQTFRLPMKIEMRLANALDGSA